MSGILSAFIGRVAGVVTDAYFNLVTLLLPGNGTNGAQNNTFLDSSSNNFTITRNGNTTQGTFSPFSQTGWSGNFNTSTTYLTVTDTANLRFGSGNFTIEAWVYRAASGAIQTIASKGASTPTGWVFQISAADKLVFTDTSTSITGATTLNANTWYYVAVVRAGTGTNQTTLYVNAASDATGTSSTNFNQTTNMLIGADRSTANFANGYISNLRLSNTNRTISSTPTSALTADSNTIFLALNSNWFQYTDSTAAYTAMAVTGTPSVQAFSPFAPTAAYSAATVGGSGYFDGTGDNLTVPTNSANSVGSGSFYFEAWVYLTNPSVAQMIIADPSNTGGLFVGLNIDGGGRFAIGRTAVAVDNFVNLTWLGNSWYHLAVNRNGTSLQFFVNGTQVGSTGTNSVNYPSVGYRIGAEQAAGSAALTGYISGLRLVKSSVNTTNFTPPTAPPDASGSALCLQFTNAGITDATAKNDLETVGNAQISTTQSKFGGSSMYFDGTGDYLLFPSSPNLAFGTGDYTVEAWVYFTSISGAALQVIFRSGAGGNNFYFHVDSDQISVGTGSAFISNQATTFNTNTWYHIAACRSGTTLRLFRDGVQVGSSVTDSTNWVSTGIAGVGSNETGIQTVFGYIDDLRVSRYARYTANFTPPTTAFPLQ